MNSSTEPKQTELPWWVTLIAVVVTAVACVMGTVYALGGGGPKAPNAPAGIGSLVGDTITYIPHIMLLFGVLADMFTYEGVYSIPSLVGILSIFFNWIFKYFWRGVGAILEKTKMIATAAPPAQAGGAPTAAIRRGTPTPPVPTPAVPTSVGKFFKDYDGCSVQGFSGFASPYAPQTLVVTATVFMYYLFDNVSNRGWINSLAGFLFFAAVYIGQSYVVGQCPSPVKDVQFSTTQQSLMALVEGMIMGGLSYSVVAAYYPTRLPSSVISPFPRKSRADLTVGPNGGYVDSEGNPYIVLPNGQAVPDLSSDDARKKFAAIAGANLGTGAAAMPGNCSSST